MSEHLEENAELDQWTRELEGLSAYRLADMAECGGPDAPNSAGAELLESVRNAVVEAVRWIVTEDGLTLSEALAEVAEEHHELVDGALPIYTGPIWASFVDLEAHREDPSELSAHDADMTSQATACLYIIADRLAAQLIDSQQEVPQE